MPANQNAMSQIFQRGTVVLSIDTEQVWGYLGYLNEAQFLRRYPESFEAHDRLLKRLSDANVRATWLVVGALALGGSLDFSDSLSGLPSEWTAKILRGDERTAPLWYRRSFVDRLRDSQPSQEIGLHGGLTHLIWTDAGATSDVMRQELAGGLRALHERNIHPCAFSFARDEEAHHQLLPRHGIRVYRGRTPVLAYQLGHNLPGALLRAFDEVVAAAPPPVWPHETLPGLWNIPSSLFLYPMTPWRTKIIGLRSRIRRFRQGIEAAARTHGIFHFCLHPENLAESEDGFPIFDEILEVLIQSRARGDVEIQTMGDIAALIEQEVSEVDESVKAPAVAARSREGAGQTIDDEIVGLA